MTDKINKIKVNNVSYDVEDTSKQEILVSGTNIKTINGNSILGSGNMVISGGSGVETNVQINGTSITSDGVANIVTETAYNASSNKLATMSDVPDISGKQDTLVSGTNIKTINNTSILGSGNLSVEALPEIYIGDSTPSDNNIVLWVDTSDMPQAPDPVTNLAGTSTSSTIALTWTASSGATSYKVYNGDTLVDTTANTSYTVTGLTSNTQYTLGVIASNTVGDSSKVTVTVTTQESTPGVLPAEYQQVNYVIATAGKANNGIRTGLDNDTIKKFEMGLETKYSDYTMAMATVTSQGAFGSWYFYNTLDKTAMTCFSTNGPVVTSVPASSSYVGNTSPIKVEFTTTFSSAVRPGEFYSIGECNPSTWAANDKKYYYVKFYDSQDNLVGDYVPCYRKSDDTVGMYDLVSETFKTPLNGAWGKGADV